MKRGKKKEVEESILKSWSSERFWGTLDRPEKERHL